MAASRTQEQDPDHPSPVPLRPLHQLRAPLPDFVGREIELAQLEDAIAAGGATISGLRGMGGVGKTELALVLAHRLRDRYPDAQFYLDLKGTSPTPLTAADAMAHVIRAYHPTEQLPEDEGELAAMYHSVLHGAGRSGRTRALLLMDNAAGRAQVEPLLPPASCLLLVTSRQRFALPGLVALDLDALPLEEAVELLCRIAPRLRHDRRPPLNPPRTVRGGEAGSSPSREGVRSSSPPASGGDRGGAIELAHLCGRLPLALRLAASALAERPDLPVDEYLDRLRQAGHVRSEWIQDPLLASYDLLSETMQDRWRMLAVFPGTFDRAGAAAVWGEQEGKTQEALSELVRYSMLE